MPTPFNSAPPTITQTFNICFSRHRSPPWPGKLSLSPNPRSKTLLTKVQNSSVSASGHRYFPPFYHTIHQFPFNDTHPNRCDYSAFCCYSCPISTSSPPPPTPTTTTTWHCTSGLKQSVLGIRTSVRPSIRIICMCEYSLNRTRGKSKQWCPLTAASAVYYFPWPPHSTSILCWLFCPCSSPATRTQPFTETWTLIKSIHFTTFTTTSPTLQLLCCCDGFPV